ncbi:hypothetical protein O1L60_37700 [Streptomyces diastatochromogenes]|nr:hypothetical protein [Streptomyces diastatochromogenes]
MIRSVATSRYLDRSRLHAVDFTGETYSVKGPSIVPRPPQGGPWSSPAPGSSRPVSPMWRWSAGPRPPRRARRRGRGAPLAFAEVEVALDTPGETARERIADLERYAPGRAARTGCGTPVPPPVWWTS